MLELVMFKIRLAAMVTALSLAAIHPAAAVTIRMASVADFAPYNYLDDQGVLQGFEADLATMLCAQASLQCEWVLAPWDEMITGLLEQEFDVIMTGMQITTSREMYIDFSDEYFPADPSAFLALDGGVYPSSIDIVGAQTDTLQVSYVTNEGWAVSAFPEPEDAIAALLAGEISAFVADQAYLQSVVDANPGQFALVASDVVIGGGIGLGIRESTPGLRASLNAAIAALKADGTLDALIGTWFDGRDPNYRGAP